MVVKNNYDENQIKVLEGLEAVRVRPEMYIGSREKKGLHHLLWEILDNSVDEYMAGFCNEVNVIIHKDDSITLRDNGRGIPVGMHKTQNKTTLEVVLTVLHAGGKFGGDSPYKSSGGLHGVGAACVNALSEHVVAKVYRDGKIHQMEFKKGIKTTELDVVGEVDDETTGTEIWFKPDKTIFTETTEFDYQVIFNRLRESSFLNGGLTIVLTDERQIQEDGNYKVHSFHYEDGIKDFIKHLNRKRKPVTDEIFHFEVTQDDVYVEAAFQYTNSYDEHISSFANNIKTNEGGNHETGFKSGITSVIKQVIDSQNLLKEDDESLTGDDARTGLVSVISVKVQDPQFEGQTKNKLVNVEVRSIVQNIIQKGFSKAIADNPKLIKPISNKVLESYRERISLKKARKAIRKDNKREDSSFTLPEKLTDCRQKTPPEKRELFIVEGDSAGGSAKQGRYSEFQAVLPLRGKILNVERATEGKFNENAEIEFIKSVIGAGIGEDFDYEKLRYGKIIIMTDADVDGAHIRVLLLTFFYRFMRPLIEKGHIYFAQPPLYGLKRGDKVLEFVQNEDDLEDAKKRHPKASVQRYKGLGEMDAKDLKETTMDPNSRTLVRLTTEDFELIDDIFESLMGNSPEERKMFIESNSHKADIDI